jgi:hypothetical protein
MCVTNNSKVIIECPSCGSKNRVPVSMCNDLGAGKCGKCKSPLGEKEGWLQRVVGGNMIVSSAVLFVYMFVIGDVVKFLDIPYGDKITTILMVLTFPMIVLVWFMAGFHSSFLEKKRNEKKQGYFPPDWEGDFSIGRKTATSNYFQKSQNNDDDYFDDDFWKNKHSFDPVENMNVTGHY